MFSKKSSKDSADDVTEQILFCQNGINHLNISSKENNSISDQTSSEEMHPVDEVLMVDIHSNRYQYDSSSFQLNVIQQCSVISIISPYAFTIQLTRDFMECEEFFRNMNEYYNSIVDLQIPPEYLRKNLLCVTFDESISAWNRSQIMEFNLNEDTVNVFFVDLNSWEENVSRSRLRFILTKYSFRSVYLLTCRLASIASLNDDHQEWNDVVSKTFENVVRNCQCDVELLYKRCDDIFYVNLFARHDEAYVCVNDFLIHCQMARPIADIINEENVIRIDDDGEPMHSMIALYWKAGETTHQIETSVKSQEDDQQSIVSNGSLSTKYPSLTKVIVINEKEQIIFARYKTYIMLPWFTMFIIFNELDEEKIKILANQLGFKPIMIDPLSDPLLCSQLLKLVPSTTRSTQISLYSIDCVRKIFRTSQYQQRDIYDLLDQARLAEANGDITFWDKSHEGCH